MIEKYGPTVIFYQRQMIEASTSIRNDIPSITDISIYAAGFVNRVVPEEALDAEVEALVGSLMAKPKLALLETKAHVNAVTESMVGTGRSWADADGLLAGLRDGEGRASAQAYVERLRRKQ